MNPIIANYRQSSLFSKPKSTLKSLLSSNRINRIANFTA
jgi:hypothetical protein